MKRIVSRADDHGDAASPPNPFLSPACSPAYAGSSLAAYFGADLIDHIPKAPRVPTFEEPSAAAPRAAARASTARGLTRSLAYGIMLAAVASLGTAVAWAGISRMTAEPAAVAAPR